MARDPYSWAAEVGERGQRDKEQAQLFANNALMNIFAEEASRQRPYAVMPAALAQANFDRQNALPFQIATEQRQLQNQMALRRYYAENPIPRATDEEVAVPDGTPLPDGSIVRRVGGLAVKEYPDGRKEVLK